MENPNQLPEPKSDAAIDLSDNNNPNVLSALEALPDEVLLRILQALDKKDLVRLGAVNKKLRHLTIDRSILQQKDMFDVILGRFESCMQDQQTMHRLHDLFENYLDLFKTMGEKGTYTAYAIYVLLTRNVPEIELATLDELINALRTTNKYPKICKSLSITREILVHYEAHCRWHMLDADEIKKVLSEYSMLYVNLSGVKDYELTLKFEQMTSKGIKFNFNLCNTIVNLCDENESESFFNTASCFSLAGAFLYGESLGLSKLNKGDINIKNVKLSYFRIIITTKKDLLELKKFFENGNCDNLWNANFSFTWDKISESELKQLQVAALELFKEQIKQQTSFSLIYNMFRECNQRNNLLCLERSSFGGVADGKTTQFYKEALLSIGQRINETIAKIEQADITNFGKLILELKACKPFFDSGKQWSILINNLENKLKNSEELNPSYYGLSK